MVEEVKEKEFPFADVLDITIDRNLSNGTVEVLEFMTGNHNIFTSQYPRIRDECRSYIFEQHPRLDSPELKKVVKKLDKSLEGIGVNEEKDLLIRKRIVNDWLTEQINKYGKTIKIKPIPSGVHKKIDVVDEAIEMMGGPKNVSVRVIEY